MEGSHSGLVRSLGERVWGNPSRVRISYPPLAKSAYFTTYFFGRCKRIRIFTLDNKLYLMYCLIHKLWKEQLN